MIQNIKNKIYSNKKLFENFISLYLLQGSNYILPLLVLPYLSRVLGPDKFGLVSFANAFVAYFIAITDYGFNLSATRQLAIYKEDKLKVNEIFSAVLIIKTIMALFCFFVLVLIVNNFSAFKSQANLYYVTFGLVVGAVFFPTWFYQGMEDMKYITLLNFLLKIGVALGVFVLITSENDYLLVQLLYSVTSVVVAFISLLVVFYKYKVRLKWCSFETLGFYFKDGQYIFFTSVLTTVYNQSNIFLLGIFSSNTIVGYFTIADKIRSVILALLTPITSSLYPYLSSIFKEDVSLYIHKHRQLFKLYLGFTLVVFSLAFLFDDNIVRVVSGIEFLPAVPIFKILMFSILVNGVGHLYTTLFLVVKGDNLKVLRFFSISLLAYILGVASLYFFEAINQYTLSYVLVVSESCVVIGAFFYFRKWRKHQSFGIKY